MSEQAKTTSPNDRAAEAAKCALSSIKDMVAALECDYDRLAELRDERDGWKPAPLVEAKQNQCPECGRGSYSADPILSGGDYVTCEDCGARWREDENGVLFSLTWAETNPNDAEELAELEEAAGDCTDREDAEHRIQEDPLSVEVRGDWHAPGQSDGSSPTEYKILLSTGGPATQIVGDLDEHGQPTSARIQGQDWFTPWVEHVCTGDDAEALLTYAQQFYFGD